MPKVTIRDFELVGESDIQAYTEKRLAEAGFDPEKNAVYERDWLKGETNYIQEDEPEEDPEEYDDLDDGKRMIYRTYNETEVASLWTFCKCPHCGHEQSELDMNDCGETYEITCENEKCEKEYKMYFDAS